MKQETTGSHSTSAEGILFRISEQQRLEPVVRLGGGIRRMQKFIRLVQENLPLCIQAALQFPGLFSVNEPQRACSCPLASLCGKHCVHTVRVSIPEDDQECILVAFQEDHKIQPHEDSRLLEQLLFTHLQRDVQLSSGY